MYLPYIIIVIIIIIFIVIIIIIIIIIIVIIIVCVYMYVYVCVCVFICVCVNYVIMWYKYLPYFILTVMSWGKKKGKKEKRKKGIRVKRIFLPSFLPWSNTTQNLSHHLLFYYSILNILNILNILTKHHFGDIFFSIALSPILHPCPLRYIFWLTSDNGPPPGGRSALPLVCLTHSFAHSGL